MFNLTVDGAREFFANGILVHNCDVAVYGCMIAEKFRTTRRFDGEPAKHEGPVFSDRRRPSDDDSPANPTDGYFVANPF